ncbi:hypothetical protein MLD38_013044 [Melastoma candidum]|uniref:Uncharacterized protein n=1 Tax=Melastoma candidum TaxID=119954 RepID=A0ACB9RCG6_9MYRT|nr:hypothetical protein MLD38_013044 [Melastoma candidum]
MELPHALSLLRPSSSSSTATATSMIALLRSPSHRASPSLSRSPAPAYSPRLHSSCLLSSLASFSISLSGIAIAMNTSNPVCSAVAVLNIWPLRRPSLHLPATSYKAASSPRCAASNPEQLEGAREDVKEILKCKFCHLILVRLGRHDAGKDLVAHYSVICPCSLLMTSITGLVNALKLLEPFKDKYFGVSYADLFQLTSATAIEEAGGPKIPMKYGRVDVSSPEECPEEGRLPDAGLPSPVIIYVEFSTEWDSMIRSRPERSGWGKLETKYAKDGPGAPGGQSWTVQWLKFDNSYFKDIKAKKDEDLLVLPTDVTIFDDPSFKVYAEKYAEDQETFFNDCAEAHAKLSNLGAKFDPPEGIVIDDGPAKPAPEKFVAANYSSGKV